MSMLDKMVAAMTPSESDAQRREVRSKARELAARHGWLAAVLDHHEQIEEAFANVVHTDEAATRRAAQTRLGIVLTAHAIAEESVLYPALARIGDRSLAESAYKEQAEAKMNIAELERIAPMSGEYLEKLEALRKAVAHHVFQEEGTWFVELATKAPMPEQDRIEQRYESEFARYMGAVGSENGRGTPFSTAPTIPRRTTELTYGGATEDRGR